jgi:hypothetical protein
MFNVTKWASLCSKKARIDLVLFGGVVAMASLASGGSLVIVSIVKWAVLGVWSIAMSTAASWCASDCAAEVRRDMVRVRDYGHMLGCCIGIGPGTASGRHHVLTHF